MQPEPASVLADADPADVARAKQLFASGQTFFEQGDIANALSPFERAYDAVPRATIKYSIGHCLERLGRVQEACDALLVVAKRGDDDVRGQAAQTRAILGC